jgi:flagellar motor switch protein FliG
MAKLDKTEKQILEEINEKLNKLIALNAVQGKNKVEQIKILASLGFTNVEISKLTAIPKGTVDSTRAKIK